MKRTILLASMAIASGIALTNMYTSIVDVPAWERDIPASIETARQYFGVSDPGNFFRIFSPFNQFLAVASLILVWRRGSQVRTLLLAALLFYVAGELLTFQYFYPRNEILFSGRVSDGNILRSVMSEWKEMNWVRTGVVLAGVMCSALALHRSYLAPAVATRKAEDLQGAGAIA